MSDIIARCYSDLDEAARIFADNRSDDGLEPMIIIPNRNVALGVKMRIAMIKEDWTTVKSLANEILQNVPLTKSSELTSGFMEAAPSWIWGSYGIPIILLGIPVILHLQRPISMHLGIRA